MEDKKIITYAEIKERLKNVPLEQMSAQDLFARYIAYGTEEELNTPEIQSLLIKHTVLEVNEAKGYLRILTEERRKEWNSSKTMGSCNEYNSLRKRSNKI